MPSVGEEGFITGLSLNLGKVFRTNGERHKLPLCRLPDPKGSGLFAFARGTFHFGAQSISQTLTRSCRGRG